jgi:hypothetical protein
MTLAQAPPSQDGAGGAGAIPVCEREGTDDSGRSHRFAGHPIAVERFAGRGLFLSGEEGAGEPEPCVDVR